MEHIRKRKISTWTVVNPDGSKTVTECGEPPLTSEDIQFLNGLIYLIGMEYTNKIREELE